MARQAVTIDVSELDRFFEQVERAGNSDFKKEVQKFMEGIGDDFLRIVEDEIIRKNAMDTRLLLNSFHKGHADNIWIMSNGGMTIEIGTNLEYASYVNDGHWTCPKGVNQRFIPGDVVIGANGKIKEFTYNPSAKSGMLLKQKWVKGKHYWESSIGIIEQIIPHSIENKMEEWLCNYFGV